MAEDTNSNDTDDSGEDTSESPGTQPQGSRSPWESPHRSTDNHADSLTPEPHAPTKNDTTNPETGDEETVDNDDTPDNGGNNATEETGTAGGLAAINWERRELGESYPDDANYHCNDCNDFHAHSISELKSHVKNDEDVTWGEYLKAANLHRCAGCGESLSTLERLYCDNCDYHPDDRIPCRNCGAVRVKVSDPFCSAGCAGNRIEATDGPPTPLDPPNNPSDEWLDHPHRLPEGIPSGAPFIENHWLACRECYEYGADRLHKFAVHVSERHDFGWGGYISEYALRRCRVCNDPLESLLPLYCSDDCQHNDPDPLRECKRRDCETAVERRQKYCSRDCYTEADR